VRYSWNENDAELEKKTKNEDEQQIDEKSQENLDETSNDRDEL